MSDKPAPEDIGRKLLAEHRQLYQQIEEIRTWWHEADELGTPKFGEMADYVQRIRDLLAQHFADEEEGGYLAGVLEAAPRFTPQAEELVEQHPQMLSRLDDFIARLRVREPPFKSWQEAHNEFEDILETLRAHDAAENEIAQAAFEDDLGAGD